VVAPETLILAALALHCADPSDGTNPWAARDGFTPNLPATLSCTLSWKGQANTVEHGCKAGSTSAATVDGRTLLQVADLAYAPDAAGAGTISARLVERRRRARCRVAGGHVTLWEDDAQYDFLLEDPRTREFTASAATGGLTTPLPGVVVSVPVSVGQKVAAGEVLMVIEAMKMEHTISAPHAGKVQVIHFARGDRVPEGSQLLELTAAEDASR
jgi:3-methylcrotonyl-CoA carboxylase alpha subunit